MIFENFRFRKRVLALADAFIVSVAVLIANFPLPLFAERIGRPDLFVIIIVSVICCFGSLLFFGAYNKMWRYFNRKDYLSCVKGVFVGILLSNGLFFLFRNEVYWEFACLHLIISIIGISLFRYIFRRVFISIVNFGHKEEKLVRTMIIGAGKASSLLLQEIKNNLKDENYNKFMRNSLDIFPVCLIDDDRYKIGKIFEGVLVAGSTSDIPKVVKEFKIEQIIFAIPSCPSGDRRVILDICGKTNLPIKVLPFIGTLLNPIETSSNFVNQIRNIKMEDLLGREPINFNNIEIKNFIENKVCMVTGGGGSIGSELVRQIAKYNPRKIVIVDIYENNAYEIEQELAMEYGDKLNFSTIIASVRDYFRMNQIFKKYSPQIVFHAAAHKHVPLMEKNPMEAIKNNVIGTFNLATLSLLHNVQKFVMISTDKAVNPTNVMGASKRCCEMIMAFFAQQKGKTEFVTTRFGNVLGSNGSVIPLFKKQIEEGKPVTVTHPKIIRYFMTIPEAVNLVLTAGSFAHGGEIFVLDMGEPVKILTLAENLIRMYGKIPYKEVPIKFTGLRPGEKLLEELLMNEEGLQKTRNKLIYIGKQIPIDIDKFVISLWNLKNAAQENNESKAVSALHEIVPTFTTPEKFNSTIKMESV